jgi:hypothetical protein
MIQKRKDKKHHESDRPWIKDVKKFSHRRDRAAVRNALKHGEFDKIPKQKPIKEEDSWTWD